MTDNNKGVGGLISYGTPAPPSGAVPVVVPPQASRIKQQLPPPKVKNKGSPHSRNVTPRRKPQPAPPIDLIGELLPKVKANLILTHDEDDVLLRGHILAAVGYAESYQKRSYANEPLPPTTEQAIIMLASHFFESRDGSTGGFFADYVGASKQIWEVVNRLLLLEKRWEM